MPSPRTLKRNDCTLAFEAAGEHAGETLVLLHGFGMCRDSLRLLAARLRESGAVGRTLLVDSRGHGDTRTPATDDAYRYSALRDDLFALLEQEAPAGAHLVGHSMGGQVALLVALAHPERVRSLTVIGGGPCRAITSEREKSAWRRAADRFEQAAPSELFTSLEAAAPTRDANLKAEKLYARARGDELARVVRGGFLHVEEDDEACSRLRRPILVIVGADDRTWLAASRRLAELVPGSRLRVVEAAGHLVHLERPAECARWISEHVRGAAARD